MASVAVLVEHCDRHPSARAAWWVVNGLLELAFCQHCLDRHNKVLTDQGFDPVLITDYPPLEREYVSG